MKSKIYLLILMGALFAVNGCQTPDELLPPVARAGINSVTAAFEDKSAEFTALVTEGVYDIVIPIPYYFPETSDNQVTNAMLSRMKMRADVDDNVYIDPPLLFLDLTPGKVHTITVTDQRKGQKQYTIRSEIRKSAACAIEEFVIPLLGDATMTGIITESTKTISLLTPDVLAPCTATVRLSPHATISPDPRTTLIDYNTNQTFTVTAHDGTTATYTVKKELPAKRAKGIRPESAKLIFVKTAAEIGANSANYNGIAVTGDRIVISSRAAASKVIDAFTGAQLPDLDVTHTAAGLPNFYNTADAAGNVLMSDLYNTGSVGTFAMWRIDPVAGTINNYITWTAAPRQIGRKISIAGSIDGNAIITAPLHGTDDHSFARWRVINGALVSQTPDIVTISGDFLWANNGSDIIYSSADPQSDYFAVGYKGSASTSSNKLVRIDGTTNTVAAALDPVTDNTVVAALDYIEFNNAKYVAFTYARNTTGNEKVYLVDVEEPLSGTPGEAAIWEITNTYGAGSGNGNSTSDIVLKASADGDYLYLYYYFTNGAIVCYQFDTYDI
ncbi:MAG: DUF5018 domain-containing protein [Prevotellaceae bacterium]|jgi:hypothetical protein|nr:DUF5018 domain-containing protein [Prevotellaceae bacterium]